MHQELGFMCGRFSAAFPDMSYDRRVSTCEQQEQHTALLLVSVNTEKLQMLSSCPGPSYYVTRLFAKTNKIVHGTVPEFEWWQNGKVFSNWNGVSNSCLDVEAITIRSSFIMIGCSLLGVTIAQCSPSSHYCGKQFDYISVSSNQAGFSPLISQSFPTK